MRRSRLADQSPSSGLKTQTKDFGVANLDWLRGDGSYSNTFICLFKYFLVQNVVSIIVFLLPNYW